MGSEPFAERELVADTGDGGDDRRAAADELATRHQRIDRADVDLGLAVADDLDQIVAAERLPSAPTSAASRSNSARVSATGLPSLPSSSRRVRSMIQSPKAIELWLRAALRSIERRRCAHAPAIRAD